MYRKKCQNADQYRQNMKYRQNADQFQTFSFQQPKFVIKTPVGKPADNKRKSRCSDPNQ